MGAGMLYAANLGANLAGNYLSGRAKKKAAKKQMQMMQKALKQYQAGATDALGNKLSANSDGSWNYTLNQSGKAAANAARNANIRAGTALNKSRQQILRDNLLNTQRAAQAVARANQGAAMRSGARGNVNLGNIASAYARQGSRDLYNNYMNAVKKSKNSDTYNANIAQNLAQAASSAANPINNIQGNLRNMVNGLNGTVLNQQNALAKAASNPYLYGQTYADILKQTGTDDQYQKMLQLLGQMNG